MLHGRRKMWSPLSWIPLSNIHQCGFPFHAVEINQWNSNLCININWADYWTHFLTYVKTVSPKCEFRNRPSSKTVNNQWLLIYLLSRTMPYYQNNITIYHANETGNLQRDKTKGLVMLCELRYPRKIVIVLQISCIKRYLFITIEFDWPFCT